MAHKVILILGILLITSEVLAQVPLGQTWGAEGTTGVFSHNVARMLKDPVFLGVTLLAILVSRRFLYWGMVIVGVVAGPAGFYVTTKSFGYQQYVESGMAPWASAALLGGALGLAAVFTFRFIGARE